MDDIPPFPAEFETRLNEIMAQRSPKVFGFMLMRPSVKKVWSNRFINKKPLTEVVLKPSAFIKGLFGLGGIYIILVMSVVEYKTDDPFPLLAFLPMLILFGVGSFWHLNRQIIVNTKGISLEREFIAWADIVECYIMETPHGRSLKETLFILLNSSKYVEFDLRALDRNDVANYIYKFKAEAQAGGLKA